MTGADSWREEPFSSLGVATDRGIMRYLSVVLATVVLIGGCSSSESDDEFDALVELARTEALTSTTTVTPTSSQPTTTAAPTTTTTSTTLAALEGPVFDIAFDGTTCTVVGPTRVPPGTYSFFLTDTSSFGVLPPGVIRAGDGHSYEDLVALQSAPAETFSFPEWASLAMTSFAPMSRHLADNEVRLVLDPGEYGIALVRGLPEAKWFCSGISVTEP
jgi:hypothetical protein